MAPRGRPRQPGLDAAAMKAAIALISEAGYSSLTMAHIAERAVVSRAALYRRWPNKLELVVDAIEAFGPHRAPVPDTGHAAADVVELLHTLVRGRPEDAEAYEALSNALAAEPQLASRCSGPVLAGLSAALRTIVTRAVDRGELPSATDVELLAQVVPALIRHRRQIAAPPLDDGLIERMADQFFGSATGTVGGQQDHRDGGNGGLGGPGRLGGMPPGTGG